MNTPFQQLPRYTTLGDGKMHRVDEDERPTTPMYLRLEDVETYFASVQQIRGEVASAIMRLGGFLDQR